MESPRVLMKKEYWEEITKNINGAVAPSVEYWTMKSTLESGYGIKQKAVVIREQGAGNAFQNLNQSGLSTLMIL